MRFSQKLWRKTTTYCLLLLLPVATGCFYFNTPIVFYGKVVDQNNSPVARADVLVSEYRAPLIQLVILPLWEGNAEQLSQYHIKTDQDGKYTFIGLGLSITTSISAPGYAATLPLHTPLQVYNYEADYPAQSYVPHPDRPEVWTLWKLSGPQPLITGGDHLRFFADGKPHGVDLVHNRKARDGGPADFWVTMVAPPGGGWSDDNHIRESYEWSYTIKAADGGFARTDEPYPYIAPTVGYAETCSEDFKNFTRRSPRHGQDMWHTRGLDVYYLRCHNGQIYARIEFEWNPDSNHPCVDISYTANTAGSRNLEPGLETKLPPGRQDHHRDQ